MILAAGKGRRMLPLSRTIPKPLLEINGKSLLQRHIERLVGAGFTQIVINLYHLGEQIEGAIGDGSRWDIEIVYVSERAPLETGGGITHALPFLGKKEFAVVNGDIWVDYDFSLLPDQLVEDTLGHLVMVDNPEHHPAGDFSIDRLGRLGHVGEKLTYSGISVLSPLLFEGCIAEPFPLLKLLDPAITAGRFTGEHFKGYWSDVGTITRYQKLQSDQS